MGVSIPRVTFGHEPLVESFDMTMDIGELMRINRKRTWALSREELLAIKAYFLRRGRDPRQEGY